ncbi:pentapeptide repeat-containing protein [Spirochaeta cellobiosiphila]|uniref:pentapeptide repeat-containing protein n=1 Tax=Spirochaeta cellobiosiphila TaxID=504483 RepID=UPI00040C7CAC|nr:pentapeptide repeat-containing protein [Spirochaeta cellobiosiphila]
MEQDNFIGNGKHLKVLLDCIEKSDVSIWNSFVRKQGPYFKADLKGLILEAEALAKINLRFARLQGAFFKQCDLTGANFSGSDITDATFNSCNLSGANFGGVNIKAASFEDTELRGIVLGRKVKVKAIPKTKIPDDLDKDDPLWRKLKQLEMQESAVAYNKEVQREAAKKKQEEDAHKLQKDSRLFELDEEPDNE